MRNLPSCIYKKTNVNHKISNKELLEFLGLPSTTKVFPFIPSTYFEDFRGCNIEGKKYYLDRYDELCVYRYYEINRDRYLIRVGNYSIRNTFTNHNPFGFAWINFYSDTVYLTHLIKGHPHNHFGPAMLNYRNGMLVKEEYYLENIYHNIQGPAARSYEGGRWYNSFYIHGKLLTYASFCKIISKRMNNEDNGRDFRRQ